jgi:hypothetical protein
MRGAAVRAPLGRPYARTKRERVGRAGGIAAARAVVWQVRALALCAYGRAMPVTR